MNERIRLARFACLLFPLFLLLSLIPRHGLAASPDAAEEGIVLRVGIYENAPKVATDNAGKPVGIFIDLLEHMAGMEGWTLRYVPGTWAENVDRLEQGEIDLLPDVAYSAERATRYAFHKTPVLSSWFQVYAPKGHQIRSLLDLNHKKVLVLERSLQEEAFRRLGQGFGLVVTLISVPDYQTMFAMVARGEADAGVTNRFYGKVHAKRHGLEDTAVIFEPSDLFFAATKGDPHRLLTSIDRHLAALKQDNQSLYYTSLRRWIAEEVRFQVPFWVQAGAIGMAAGLFASLVAGAVLKYQVKARTLELRREVAERQAAQQRFMDIIEFLPDPTFVIDEQQRVIAWNLACETMTGVDKAALLGRGAYVYAEAFHGIRGPMLVDLLDQPEAETAVDYAHLQRLEGKLYGEALAPHLRDGRGALLWEVASPLYDQDGRRCGAIQAIRDVTEPKRMEAALKASEREYRELLMLANSIILRWTPDGRITFLNEFGQRFFGYGAEEILGRNMIGTIVPESETHGRDLRALIGEIGADPRKFERNVNENMRRNGDRVWIDWTNKMVPNEQGGLREILSIGSDVTERRQAEEQIRRLNEELRRHAETLEQRVADRTAELAALNDEQQTIFESVSAGIVLLQGRTICRCNRRLEEIAGYEPGELIGRSSRIWYADEESFQTVGEKVYAHLAQGETYCLEQRMPRKDGSLFWARLRLRALDQQAPIKGVVGIVEDITAEHDAAEQLRQALEAAQEADRIKSAFLATMSHELRTPLNSIIGFTGIMLQGLTGPLNPEQHKQMGMVQKSARHLLALINDVLDISKIEAGQLQLAVTTFELRPSIEKTARLIAPMAEQKGIDLMVEIAADVGTISTDQRRLEQVLLNLLSNALKFTENGSVGIRCVAEADRYLIEVIDTGIGIQAEEMPRLFQPFHQIDTGLSRKHDGTGLGLSICQKIVDLMGGAIEVHSQWGEGTVFAVRLPRQAGERA